VQPLGRFLAWWFAEIRPVSSWTTLVREGMVGGGTHARARKSAIFAVQDGKIPDSPPRKPALRGPRRRGVWGGSLLFYPPPLPGPSRPLRGGRRGSSGGGSDPRPGPRPAPHPLAAYLSTPGRPLSPRLSLRGLCGDPRGSAATPCKPPPAPGPSGAFPYAKVNFREKNWEGRIEKWARVLLSLIASKLNT
jgi:hypothetical protein